MNLGSNTIPSHLLHDYLAKEWKQNCITTLDYKQKDNFASFPFSFAH